MEGQSVKLCYWAIRGLSQRIRHLLQYCGVPYTQELYAGQEGSDLWFKERMPELFKKNPAINLPCLIDGDKVIAQSDAICMYICFKANKPQLLGKNPEQVIAMATVYGVFKDLMPAFGKLAYGKYAEKNEWKAAIAQGTTAFQKQLTKLNALLGDQDFMTGNLTWIDFPIADLLQAMCLISGQILKSFPKLVEYQKRRWNLPELKAYLASDKYKEKPVHGDNTFWK